ncbi:uncharacterized protein LOC134290530 [Aedes albopictus]|uniref:RNA-directed DNA polymerase n=1 Tax=Aedes albopictus TaxID=7160 RepID=A0ABM1YQL4_AEDAL
MVTSAPVLRYFDVQKDVVIQCDSSSVGLGAVLLQDGQPVVYASKTLNATDRNGPQVCADRERNIGHPVCLPIFQKPLVEAPLRIQRMLLALQRYNTVLRFTPGKEVIIADMLSRASIADNDVCSKDICDVYALEYIPILDDRVLQIKAESKQDPEIQTIIQFVIDGWPTKSEVPESLQDILDRLHQSRSGIEATTKLARDTVFWPGIYDQIRQKVQQCDICQKIAPNQQLQPMQSHQIPSYPFQELSMDLCEIELGGRKARITAQLAIDQTPQKKAGELMENRP